MGETPQQPFLKGDVLKTYSSESARKAKETSFDKRDAGKQRQAERDAKRQESRETWAARWQKVKEVGAKAWDTVKSGAGEVASWPGKIVDGADALRTRAEVGIADAKADLIQGAYDVTNKAGEKMDQLSAFIDSLPARAEAKVEEVKLAALKAAAEGVKSLLEAANQIVKEGQESDGEQVVTAADRIKQAALEKRAKQQQAAQNAQSLGGVRGWLKNFAK